MTPETLIALSLQRALLGAVTPNIRQVSFRLAPLNDADIDALLSEQPATRLLAGARGRRPADLSALAEVLRRLSDIARLPGLEREISEIEINPLVAGEHGVLALDALIVLRGQET